MIRMAVKTEKVQFVQYNGDNYDDLLEVCQGYLCNNREDWKRGWTLYVYDETGCSHDVDKGDYVVRHDNGIFEVLTEKEFQSVYQETDS